MAPGATARRDALRTAATVSLAALAVSTGIATNVVVQRVRRAPSAAAVASPIAAPAPTPAAASTTTLPPEIVTVYQDVPGPATPGTVEGAPAPGAPGDAPGTAPGPGGPATAPPATGPATAVTPAPTTAPAASGATTVPGTYVESAGPAGTVVVDFDGSRVTITPEPAPGWTARAEKTSGDEVKVEFLAGERKIVWEARVDDGVLRVHWKED